MPKLTRDDGAGLNIRQVSTRDVGSSGSDARGPLGGVHCLGVVSCQAVPTNSAETAERLLPASVGVDLEADQFDRAVGRQLSDH
jgi:hypothetical protein